jgi:hypothetical protein
MPLFPPACLWKSLEPCLPWFRVSEMCLVSAAESGSHCREKEKYWNLEFCVSERALLVIDTAPSCGGIESCVFARLVVWRPSTVRRILRWYWCHSSVITRWYFGGYLEIKPVEAPCISKGMCSKIWRSYLLVCEDGFLATFPKKFVFEAMSSFPVER